MVIYLLLEMFDGWQRVRTSFKVSGAVDANEPDVSDLISSPGRDGPD